MGKVKIVEKKVQLELSLLIKFQLLTHCYIHNLLITEADLNCLTLLGFIGETDLSEFCNIASTKNIFRTIQTVRNCIAKMEKVGLITKGGGGKKKMISLKSDLSIQTHGSILLNYKIFYLES